jgi:hypothetical protein
VNEGQVEESEVTEPSYLFHGGDYVGVRKAERTVGRTSERLTGMKSARREGNCLTGIKRKRQGTVIMLKRAFMLDVSTYSHAMPVAQLALSGMFNY